MSSDYARYRDVAVGAAAGAQPGRVREEDRWLHAVLQLTGAAGAIVWTEEGRAATDGWPAAAREADALVALEGPDELARDDERIAALVEGCPDHWSRFVVVQGSGGAASMMLAYEGASEPLAAGQLDAVAHLAARALRPAFDRASLIETARLATAGRLAFSIAHDIGTPLNVISGYAEYLLMSVPADAPSRAGISTMLDQTRRIATMIRHMLDVSRPPAGQSRQRQALDLFVKDAIQASGYMMRKAGVKAQLGAELSGEVQVAGDLARLQQAVCNVLLNAARIAGTGGRVSVSPSEGAALTLDACDVTGTRVDLAGLVSTATGDGALAFLEMLLAAHVLAENGGAIAAGDEPGRIVIRLGGAE